MDTFWTKGKPGTPATRYANFGLPRFTVVLAEAWHVLVVWTERRQQRLTLLRLDDRMLRDIGISAPDVSQECRKPFWRA
ncbi:MAG: DUF1127 domain-containing protein [Alphaproteobacteria bacterium]